MAQVVCENVWVLVRYFTVHHVPRVLLVSFVESPGHGGVFARRLLLLLPTPPVLARVAGVDRRVPFC